MLLPALEIGTRVGAQTTFAQARSAEACFSGRVRHQGPQISSGRPICRAATLEPAATEQPTSVGQVWSERRTVPRSSNVTAKAAATEVP